jgi:hypothetical protein
MERFRVNMDDSINKANSGSIVPSSGTNSARSDWLDRLTLKAIHSSLQAEQMLSGSNDEDGIYNYFYDHYAAPTTANGLAAALSTEHLPSRHQLLRKYAFVVLEFATTSCPIVYEDNAVGAYEVMPHCPSLYHDMMNCVVENDRGVYEFSLQDRVFSGM